MLSSITTVTRSFPRPTPSLGLAELVTKILALSEASSPAGASALEVDPDSRAKVFSDPRRRGYGWGESLSHDHPRELA